MANPFFNAFQAASRGATMPRGGQNPMQMLQQLRANPVQFMKSMGYDVPAELANNPLGIAQHLAQSGQLNGTQMQQYQQMMGTQNGGQQRQQK